MTWLFYLKTKNFSLKGKIYSDKILNQNFDHVENLNGLDPEIDAESSNEAETISIAYETLKNILSAEVKFVLLLEQITNNQSETEIEISLCHTGILDIIFNHYNFTEEQIQFLINNLHLLQDMTEPEFFCFCMNKFLNNQKSFNPMNLSAFCKKIK